MQMVKKLLLLVTIWLAVIVMMPKKELYYLFEQELEKKDIVISSERIHEGWFSLRLEEPAIFVKGIKMAKVEEIQFFTLIFYTSGSIEGLVLDSSLGQMVPGEIDDLTLSHSVISPMEVSIRSSGVFGKADGDVDLREKRVKVRVSEKDKLGMLASKLTKDEEGWFYETSF